jgi:hypothetical protein
MTDTEVLIRECLNEYADTAELADLVGPAKAQSRQLSRSARSSGRSARAGRIQLPRRQRMRLIVAGAVVVVIALVAAAFALGGAHSNRPDQAALRVQGGVVSVKPPTADFGANKARRAPLRYGKLAHHSAKLVYGAKVPAGVPQSASTASGTTSGSSGTTSGATSGSAASHRAATSIGGGVGATRVVKTGDLSLTVARGQVQTTMSKLVSLATSRGGYVSKSRTDSVAGAPSGELTLRVPVVRFDSAVSAAAKLGRETSLSTDAHDVTGTFVDLNARLSALRHTRSTYLTILGRARTIGATLAVQERVDDVQSQIERLQGELKVLRNQSADATLTVDVSQAGSPTPAADRHHRRHGIAKAWHTSIRRFTRGVDVIVGALGPLLLALLILAFLAVIARLGLRGIQRRTT